MPEKPDDLVGLGRELARLRLERAEHQADYADRERKLAEAMAFWLSHDPQPSASDAEATWLGRRIAFEAEVTEKVGLEGHPRVLVDAQIDALATEIVGRIPATSLEGLAVKAQLVFEYTGLKPEDLTGQAFDDLDLDRKVVADLVRDLLRLASK